MQEVTIRLRFTQVCLGATRSRSRKGRMKFAMPRDPSGRVMFLPSWWQELLGYAAQVACRYGDIVREVAWDPIIDGVPGRDFHRTVQSAREAPDGRWHYAVHEAFRPGAVIGVHAVLPRGLPIDDFRMLLTLAGTYKGISPFRGSVETYGTFEVVSVTPVVRDRAEATSPLPCEGGYALTASSPRHDD